MEGQARIQDFGQGVQQNLDPMGGPELKICSKQGASHKIAWKLHDFEEIVGARGAQAPRALLDPQLSVLEGAQNILDFSWNKKQFRNNPTIPTPKSLKELQLSGKNSGNPNHKRDSAKKDQVDKCLGLMPKCS